MTSLRTSPVFSFGAVSRLPSLTHVGRWVALVTILACRQLDAADMTVWQSTPYTVHLTIAVDDANRPGLVDATALATNIVSRIEASIGPVWRLEYEVADRTPSVLKTGSETPTWESLSAELRSFDKVIWLAVAFDSHEITARCREFDSYVRRASPVVASKSRQLRMASENCFQLITRTFSPLTRIEPVEGAPLRARLSFKGEKMTRPGQGFPFAKTNDVYLPLLRRTNRSGELLPNGVVQLPWTLLKTSADDVNKANASSGLRNPLGVRKIGIVEQLAIRMPQAFTSTTVRFFARHDDTLGLAGYDVLLDGADDPPKQIGVTDSMGVLEIDAQLGPIAMLYLRSGGRVLAKTPVAVGAVEQVEIPISDDPARVLAEAQSQSIREELIDVVARASILAGRVRAKLNEGDVTEARRLMAQLNDLPGSSEFSLQINTAQRNREAQSDSENVQRKIDALYSDMRAMLTRFLRRREILELQGEVDAAATDGS